MFLMIQVQHLYWINFDPTKPGEFPGNHLGIVLELNHDKKSCRVIPLTRSASGVGKNKINIGKLHNFDDISYAVLDQVRTVSFNRMSKHIGNFGARIQIKIPNNIFYDLKTELIRREELNLNQSDLINFHLERLVELKKKQVVNTLYSINKKVEKLDGNPSKAEIALAFQGEFTHIQNELEQKINHLVDIEDYIKQEHPKLIDLLELVNVTLVEVNFETA